MMAQRTVTDRAHRYRANQLAPVAGKVCLFCGSTQFLVPDHWDGHPDHTTPDNLEHLCKSCNTAKGAAFRTAGRGRLTHQYNPTKGGGAANVGEWMQAVGAITPHIDRGDRGLASDMGVRAAVDMIRATPQSKRRDFAAKLRRRNPWFFSKPDARRTTPASGGIAYHTSKRRPSSAKAAASDRAKSKKAAGASSMPDEAALQAGFKRGLSLREILGNPGSDVWRSRFTAETKERAEMNRRQISREGYRVYPVKRVSGRWGFYYDVDRKKNPATASAEAFQEFHGFAPSEPDARRTTPASGGIAHHTAKRRPATAKAAASDRAKSKKAAGPGRFDVPDERIIQEGFKRGLSLAEILQQNPSIAILRNSNPAAFDRCVEAVQAKGGAANAYAVCTAAGMRKANPSDWEAGNAVAGRGSAAQARALKEHIEWVERIERRGRKLSKQELQILKQRFRKAAREKRNPALASAEAFQEFHGFEPSEVITVTKKVHYHKHLAAAGELVQLDVWGIDEQGHRIKGFKGAFLAFNETKNQLFVEGGDQSVNLADFGIDFPHELETLGRLTDIGYHTKKTHLGDEGGEAVYVHKFRSTNRNGKHVVVKIARYPDLIYDVRNEQLLFSGGSYEIIAEGINR